MLKSLQFLIPLLLCVSVQAQDVEKRLKEKGVILPENAKPIANYVSAVRTGNLLFLAGKGPLRSPGVYITGKVGQDLTPEQAYQAARLTGVLQLSAIKEAIGNLDKVKRIVKVLGMVNCIADFTEHSKVINGFSDLMVEAFGEKGKHARSSVGISSLPNNMVVEIELIVEVED